MEKVDKYLLVIIGVLLVALMTIEMIQPVVPVPGIVPEVQKKQEYQPPILNSGTIATVAIPMHAGMATVATVNIKG